MTSGRTRVSARSLTEIDFLAWLGQAMPGERLIYHRGQLALDRLARSQQVLSRLADRAHWAAARGFVHLVQRRHGTDDFSYLAIARERAADISNSL
jgi:hypothetical protein